MKAEVQGEFVGDLFAGLATGRLKRIPVKNPAVKQALSKAIGVSEDIISYIPEKIWTLIAEKQMRNSHKEDSKQ